MRSFSLTWEILANQEVSRFDKNGSVCYDRSDFQDIPSLQNEALLGAVRLKGENWISQEDVGVSSKERRNDDY